jgi:hypothetical protein
MREIVARRLIIAQFEMVPVFVAAETPPQLCSKPEWESEERIDPLGPVQVPWPCLWPGGYLLATK